MGYKLLAALLCLGLLSSCNYIVSDTEGLLRPPTLNTQQAEVYAAMDTGVNIVYKYPQKGDYRSPFIFYDLDGDTQDEAIVFYSYRNAPADTRTKILRQENGRWVAFKDFAVTSDQVDFVQFAHTLSPDSSCMIIGWKNTASQTNRSGESFLSVHSLIGDVFTDEVKRQPYVDYVVHDFGKDGLEEIVTIQRDENQRFHMALIRGVGQHIATSATLPLTSDADQILKITVGRLWDGTGAVYIDHVRIDDPVATEVIRIGPSGLSAVVSGNSDGEEEPGQALENYAFTYRDLEGVVLCRDMDGDGIVEVPNPRALPGNMEDSNELPLQLTQLMHLTAQGFTIVSTAVINKEEGYLVYFPDKWTDQVTVVRDDETDEWKFWAVDPDSGELVAELLRIQATSTKEEGGTAAVDSIDLGSRGARSFIGYIPRTSQELPSISEAELGRMFLLLQ